METPRPKVIIQFPKDVDVNDGHHTFNELYEHRCTLWIALCRALCHLDFNRQDRPRPVIWRSKKHSDGSCIPGWFVLGAGQGDGQQMTYHLPESRWEETGFACTWPQAPEYDGHTSEDVLDRIKTMSLWP